MRMKRATRPEQEMLDRAMADAERPSKDRRYIYNGETQTGPPRPLNRRPGRRKISTFNIILLLFGVGIAIVLYVNNIITINRLAYDVNQLENRYAAILNTNATLRAEVNKKSAWDRISKIATDELGLRSPDEQQIWFDVDDAAVVRAGGQPGR